MKIKPFISVFTSLLIGLLTISFSTYSVADPYSITYTGTVGFNEFPEVNEGESYSLTLVFDNGSTNTLSQTWGEENLICATFLVNNAQDVQFSNDLTVTPEGNHSGAISTDGSGILTSNFSSLWYDPITSTQYEAVGIQLTDPVWWFANDNNNVFMSGDGELQFGDAAGGVLMAPANWSDPVPYGGTCGVTAPPPSTAPATPVPTTSQWALIMLSMLIGLMVFANRRRLFQKAQQS